MLHILRRLDFGTQTDSNIKTDIGSVVERLSLNMAPMQFLNPSLILIKDVLSGADCCTSCLHTIAINLLLLNRKSPPQIVFKHHCDLRVAFIFTSVVWFVSVVVLCCIFFKDHLSVNQRAFTACGGVFGAARL